MTTRSPLGAKARRRAIRIVPDWDTLGMRATQSYTTHLEGARSFLRKRVARILPVPARTATPYTLAIFANFLTLISSVYAGIADRAVELRRRVGPPPYEPAGGRSALRFTTPIFAGAWRMLPIALDALAPQLEGGHPRSRHRG